MPAGVEVTCPPPVPEVLILSVTSCVNVALTVVAPFKMTTQVPTIPVHPPPDHPLNTAVPVGVAVRATLVPGA
jgi:hypothetical protein